MTLEAEHGWPSSVVPSEPLWLLPTCQVPMGGHAGGGSTLPPPSRPLPLEAVSPPLGLRPLVTDSTQPACGRPRTAQVRPAQPRCAPHSPGAPHITFTFPFHALEKAMATHSSVLPWRIPGMGEPGGLPSMGSHRVGYCNQDHGIWSHHIMGNRRGNSGNNVRLYFWGSKITADGALSWLPSPLVQKPTPALSLSGDGPSGVEGSGPKRTCYWEGPSELPERRSSSCARLSVQGAFLALPRSPDS